MNAGAEQARLPRWVVPVLVCGLLVLWVGGPLLLWQMTRGDVLPDAVEEMLQRQPPGNPAGVTLVEIRGPDGRLVQHGQTLQSGDRTLRVGRWESYDEHGGLIGLGSFDARGTGFYARWSDAARLLWTYHYRDGREWRYRSYHENERLAQEVHWAPNAELDGPYRSWYDNGTLRFAGKYDGGERSGTWQYHRQDGSKQLEEDYDGGVLRAKRRFAPDAAGTPIANGRWTRWNASGEVVETRWFALGEEQPIPADDAAVEPYEPVAEPPEAARRVSPTMDERNESVK